MTINQKRPEHITATDPSAISIMDAPMSYQVLNNFPFYASLLQAVLARSADSKSSE